MILSGAGKRLCVAALAVALTLDASVEELVALIALSDDARRERFHLPPACTPVISAVRSAAPDESRVTVVVDCSAAPSEPSSPIKPASWGSKGGP